MTFWFRVVSDTDITAVSSMSSLWAACINPVEPISQANGRFLSFLGEQKILRWYWSKRIPGMPKSMKPVWVVQHRLTETWSGFFYISLLYPFQSYLISYQTSSSSHCFTNSNSSALQILRTAGFPELWSQLLGTTGFGWDQHFQRLTENSASDTWLPSLADFCPKKNNKPINIKKT